MRTDACQYAMTSPALDGGSLGQPVEKGQLWLSNWEVSALSLRCHPADALARTEHKHRPVRGSMQVPAEEGTKWVSSGVMSGIYTRACCDAYWNCIGRWLPARESDRDALLVLVSTEGVAGSGPRLRDQINVEEKEVPLPAADVDVSRELTPAEREVLDKELEGFALEGSR